MRLVESIEGLAIASVIAVVGLGSSACTGPQGQAQLANYPDPRIGDADIYPPPPAGFPWIEPSASTASKPNVERHLTDQNKDGRYDAVEYRSGVITARGEDTDYDGRIDHWKRYQNTKLIEEQSDSDHDGRMDVRRVDSNDDGILEPPTTFAPQ